MKAPIPFAVADLRLSDIQARFEAERAFRDRCRRHLIVEMLEKGISDGKVPIAQLNKPGATLYSWRGSGPFSFKGMDYYVGDLTQFRITLEVSIADPEEDDVVRTSQWISLPVELLTAKPSQKVFDAWAKKRRETFADEASKRAMGAEADAVAAYRAVNKPVKPGISSRDY